MDHHGGLPASMTSDLGGRAAGESAFCVPLGIDDDCCSG